MTVGELKKSLDNFDEEMEIIIGGNFAMKVKSVGEYELSSWYTDNFKTVVIEAGSQVGNVNYNREYKIYL